MREKHSVPERELIEAMAPFERLVRSDFHEDPGLMLLIDRRAVDLSFFELRRLMDYFEVGNNPKEAAYAVRYYGLLADTLRKLLADATAHGEEHLRDVGRLSLRNARLILADCERASPARHGAPR